MNGTTRGEIVDEASNWLVGGGIVTMALFPLVRPLGRLRRPARAEGELVRIPAPHGS